MTSKDRVFRGRARDWVRLRDICGRPAIMVPVLLDRLEARQTPQRWERLRAMLVQECEAHCRAAYAALPRIVGLAAGSRDETALELAADIVMSLHLYDEADDLARSARASITRLRRLLAASLAGLDGAAYRRRLQATLACAGYPALSATGFDYQDEHYGRTCPRCAGRFVVVIGEFGYYSAIRDWHDGDVRRIPLRPADPPRLSGIHRWMYDTATAHEQKVLADGLTYLFGTAGCPHCAAVIAVADRRAGADPHFDPWYGRARRAWPLTEEVSPINTVTDRSDSLPRMA